MSNTPLRDLLLMEVHLNAVRRPFFPNDRRGAVTYGNLAGNIEKAICNEQHIRSCYGIVDWLLADRAPAMYVPPEGMMHWVGQRLEEKLAAEGFERPSGGE